MNSLGRYCLNSSCSCCLGLGVCPMAVLVPWAWRGAAPPAGIALRYNVQRFSSAGFLAETR